MKKSRLFPALVISLIIAIIFLNGIMIRENGANTETIQIHAIIDNSSDNRWVQFIAGMRQAAEDQNVKLTVMPTGHFADLAEEKTMIDRSVREGASGVILQLCEDTDVHETLQNLYGQIYVELVNTGTDGTVENITGIVSPDHKAIGEALAAESAGFCPRSSGKLHDRSCFRRNVAGLFQSEHAGISGGLTGTRDRRLLDSGAVRRKPRTCGRCWKTRRPDILVAIDNAGLEAAGEYAASLEKPIVVIGTGTSTKAIYYLDSGVVQSIVVPEDYMMGYQSVSDLADFIKKNTFTARIRTVEHRVIHQDTLFDEENQSILFPIQR